MIFSDGKFHVLPTGELLVHQLEYNDQFPGYKCRTMHRLTRQVVVSSIANVRITGELFSRHVCQYFDCDMNELCKHNASYEIIIQEFYNI